MFSPKASRLMFLSLLTLAIASGPSQASKPSGSEVTPSATPHEEFSSGYVAMGHVPATNDHLVILAEDANVRVVRAPSAVNIAVGSNCPHNWNLTGGVIRQAGFAKPRSGVAMLADALGSRAIVNGKIYPLPQGAHGISMGKDGVKIGGELVEAIAGTDIPGTSSDGTDSIEVIVPESYNGTLSIGVGNGSQINLDSWHGGKFECTMLGDARLSAKALTKLDKTVVDVRGTGSAEIDNLSTKVLVTNINGTGNLNIKSGTAEVSNATVSGTGSITMKGVYKNHKQVIEGNGTIKVN